MLECWNEDHIKRPTFAVIESKIEDLLKSDRCVRNLYILFPSTVHILVDGISKKKNPNGKVNGQVTSEYKFLLFI